MEQAIQHGANIIIKDLVRLRTRERLLIVSSLNYAAEVQAMQTAAKAVGATAEVLLLDDLHEQVGQYFDDREDAFDPYDAVIGATEYSLITTRAVKRVVQRRPKRWGPPLRFCCWTTCMNRWASTLMTARTLLTPTMP